MQYEIKPEIKGLIFDLDGTLADTLPYHYKGWQIACEKFGVSVDKEFLIKHTGSPTWVIIEIFLKENNLNEKICAKELLEEKTKAFYELQKYVKPIEPVADIVKRYYGKLPMAVGTGGHIHAVERTLEITNLRQYFDIIVTANDVKNFKPHPETFLKCAELMNIEPRFIEVFEDGDLGIEAAIAAGMQVTDVRSWYDSKKPI
jgi:beta-phosphoglucomutase family hydrolase